MPDGLPEGFAEGHWRSNLPVRIWDLPVRDWKFNGHSWVSVGGPLLGPDEVPFGASYEWVNKLKPGTANEIEVHHALTPLPEGEPVHERFTDRARKVMMLANQEAQRFNHPEIGVQHVLIALVKEGPNVAARALVHCWSRAGSNGLPAGAGQDFESGRQQLIRAVRAESERLVPANLPAAGLTLGRLPHSPLTKDLIERTIAVATRRGDAHVGSEHLLLGLIAQPPEITDRILAALGVKLVDLEREVMTLLGDEDGELTKVAAAEAGSPIVDAWFDPPADVEKCSPIVAGPPSHSHVVRGRRYTDESLRLAIDAAANLLVPGELRQPAAPGPEVRAAAEAFLTDLFGGPAEAGK